MTPTQLFRKLIDPADHAQVNEMFERLRPVIPLDRAMLCLNCESIFEAEGAQTCPSCCSDTAWSLGKALNRVTAGEPAS